MAYATQMDLENVYGKRLVTKLSDHDNDGAADQEAIDHALSAASSIIDGYLSVRYSVPLSNPPTVVRDYCVDIAWYRLAYSRLKQTNEMRLRYEDAINFFKRVGEGKASIGLDTDDDALSDDQSASMTGKTTYLLRA